MAASSSAAHGNPGDEVYTITTAQESAKLERQARTKRYLISMGIRTLCFIGAVITTGPVRWALIAAAIVLPYIAVVLANSPVRKTTPDSLPPLILNQTHELTDAESFVKACEDADRQAD